MDGKNWLLLFFVFLVVGAFAFYFTNSQVNKKSEKKENTEVSSEEAKNPPKDWVKYEGRTFSFYHPKNWHPEDKKPFGGAVIESATLNIPNATDNEVLFTASPFDAVKPEDIKREEEFSDEKNRKWTKWIREGDNYVSYGVYTKDIPVDAGSFGVHVTVEKENGELLNQLVELVKTVEFNPAEATESADMETRSE